MRRLHRLGVGSILLAASAALAGCSDSPRMNPADGGGGNGGTAAGGHGGMAAGAGGSAAAGTGGSAAAGSGGSAAGGSGGSAAGVSGGGSGGQAGGTTGVAGVGGTSGAAGVGGTSGAAGAAGVGGTSGAAGAAGTSGAAGTVGTGGVTGAGGTAGSGTAGTSGAGGTAPVLAPPAPIGYAVVNSDFASASLSLLNTSGAVTRADCVHTTTTGTGSATITGDVVLPSQPQRGGKVVLVDRGANTALTFVDPATCTFDHQISVKGGFNLSNPHDVVILGDGKAYVTRYKTNAAPTADPTTSGEDVLIVDPRNGAIQGHIDLSPYAAQVAGTTIQARPDRALIAAGKVVVSLNDVSGDFSTYGEGRIVVIDPATNQVVGSVALTGLKNCEGMDYLASAKLLLVVCGGSFGVQDMVLESGIALVDMSGASATLLHTISAVAFNARPLSFQAIAGATSAGKLRAFVNTLGAFPSGSVPAVPDGAFVVDLGTGVTSQIGTSTAYDLGIPAVVGGNLLLPDGTFSMPRVHVYDLSGAPTETSTFLPDTVNSLPPRQVAAY